MTEEQVKKTLGIAIASLVCGCFFLIPFLGMLTSLAALVLGIIALVQISGNKERLKGKGLAIAGIVLGGIGLILVPIVFLLAALIVPRLSGRSEQARAAAAVADIQVNIATALELYKIDNGAFPETAEGIDALISESASAPNWDGPYLVRKPVDPWGREYIYYCPGDYNEEYDLYSLGPDGVESDDDVTNWQ